LRFRKTRFGPWGKPLGQTVPVGKGTVFEDWERGKRERKLQRAAWNPREEEAAIGENQKSGTWKGGVKNGKPI